MGLARALVPISIAAAAVAGSSFVVFAGESPQQLNRADYERAVNAYRSCLRKSGIDVALSVDPSDARLFQWFVPAAAVDSGLDDWCYRTHLEAIDVKWQEIVRGPGPSPADVAQCAIEHGLAKSGSSFDEVVEGVPGDVLLKSECLQEP